MPVEVIMSRQMKTKRKTRICHLRSLCGKMIQQKFSYSVSNWMTLLPDSARRAISLTQISMLLVTDNILKAGFCSQKKLQRSKECRVVSDMTGSVLRRRRMLERL